LPKGLERIDLAALASPPTDGIVFHAFGRRAKRVGLRRDDIIVGTDEFRVHEYRQY
jgi:hypothetical protein